MKSYQTVFLATVVFLVGQARANPIVINGESQIKKSWERCLIHLGDKTAQVSCAVGYVTKKRIAANLHFTVPVFWSTGKPIDLKKISETISARIECDGVAYKATAVRIASNVLPSRDDELPSDRVKIDCDFVIKFPKGREFSMVVSYNQPLISGIFYYLPLFERDSAPEKDKRFMITFFPSNSDELELLTKHEKGARVLKTRVSITPKHRELIAVRIKSRKEGGSDQPAAASRLKQENNKKLKFESKVHSQ